jgi:pimeloyl-ACP methyl ester carboxylesterase
MNDYQGPMQPWPGLAAYARTVHLARSGLTLHVYDTAGDAPPLLLIHGLADEADTWRHVLAPLSAQYRVIAPDLPGFGRSDTPARAYTLPFYQGIMLELLDALAIQRATLAGHSLGAMIAQAIALDCPQRVDRLILIGGSLVAGTQKLELGMVLSLVPGLGEWLYNRLRKNPQAAYGSLEPYYGRLSALPQADRDFLFQRVNERVWSDGQRGAFLSTLRNLVRWLPGQQGNLPVRLANFTTPTVVLWGEADHINPPQNGRALLRLQPAARLVIVPGAGHNIQQDNPQAVIEAIRG